VQQAAALWGLVQDEKTKGWEELTMVFLNQATVVSTFEYLSQSFGGPAVQDADDGSLWGGFGVGYNGVLIVDREGALAANFSSQVYPDSLPLVQAALEEVLQQP